MLNLDLFLIPIYIIKDKRLAIRVELQDKVLIHKLNVKKITKKNLPDYMNLRKNNWQQSGLGNLLVLGHSYNNNQLGN